VTTLTAYNSSSIKQITKYQYTDSYDASLVTKTYYPDAVEQDGDIMDADDGVFMSYNVDGSLASREDQRDTVIEYTYTTRRELDRQKATTLGGADGTVQSIDWDYDTMGRPQFVTSWSTPTGGSVINQIQYTYVPC
jgi:hypothetical protein